MVLWIARVAAAFCCALRSLDVAAAPVGVPARRARSAIARHIGTLLLPYPALPSKAGLKTGLPHNPAAACGAPKRRLLRRSSTAPLTLAGGRPCAGWYWS
jgi:hypothetical protein